MTETHGRREVLQKAGTTVIAAAGMSQVIDVAAADTASGNVELQTVATVPANTSISITVYEDTTGDGTADRQQTESIPDGTTTTEFDLLQSTTAQGDTLWLEVSLSTSDDTVTPSLDSATLTLPATPATPTEPTATSEPVATDPQSPTEIWQDYRAFVAMVVIAFAGIGAWSKSLSIGAWAGYVAFLTIAFATGTAMFENIAYATLVLVFLGFAFKLVRLEFEGEA